MPSKRKLDKLVILLLAGGIFVYFSTRPTSRLVANMPTSFVDVPKGASAAQRAAEARVANAYWECAVTFLQFEYSYGAQLPDAVPNNFQIDKSYGAAAGPDARLRYWGRFRAIWLKPEAWRRDRGWNTMWLTDPVLKGWDAFHAYMTHLVNG